jgi:hypothetical protein
MYVLTNMTNSYNESSRVDIVLQIFNAINFMFIAKHFVFHMQFFNWACVPEDVQFSQKHEVLYSYVNISTHISQYIYCECVYLLFNICNDGMKMEARSKIVSMRTVKLGMILLSRISFFCVRQSEKRSSGSLEASYL